MALDAKQPTGGDWNRTERGRVRELSETAPRQVYRSVAPSIASDGCSHVCQHNV